MLASQKAPSMGLVTEMARAVATNKRAAERVEKARIISAGKDSKRWVVKEGAMRRKREEVFCST